MEFLRQYFFISLSALINSDCSHVEPCQEHKVLFSSLFKTENKTVPPSLTTPPAYGQEVLLLCLRVYRHVHRTKLLFFFLRRGVWLSCCLLVCLPACGGQLIRVFSLPASSSPDPQRSSAGVKPSGHTPSHPPRQLSYSL